MPKTRLTARSLAALKPGPQRTDYFDETLPGFCVRVTPAGIKTFAVMYRHAGRLRRFTIGNYPPLSLADARTEARESLRLAELGEDPAEKKKAERQADTFKELAEAFMERYSKKKKKSWREDQRKIDRYLVPKFGNLRASDVTRADVRIVLETLAEDAPIQANRVLALLRKIYNWAISQDLVETNPCLNIPRPGIERRRDRVLSEIELKRVWQAIEGQDVRMSAYFKLRLLTAQRGGEVASLAWEDLDFDAGWWTIPAEKAKNGLSHRVPLSSQTMSILKELKGIRPIDADGRSISSWVFPHRRRREEHITDIQKAVQRIREAADVEFRAHDLRRTAASLMTGMGVSRLTVGKILNHAELGVTAVYDRYGYDREKSEALEKWGRRLMAIVSDPKMAAAD